MEKIGEFYSPGQNKSICKSPAMFLNHFKFRPNKFCYSPEKYNVNNKDQAPVLSELF